MGVRFQLYRFGFSVGVQSFFAGRFRIGLKALLNPLRSGYSRFVEFPYVLEHLGSLQGRKVLDIGSPKMLALFCAAKKGAEEVRAVDVRENELSDYRQYQELCDISHITIEAGDGRSLSYPDESFDHIYSVSVIEHIDHDGDSKCMAEIARLLKKNGRCVLSFPWAPVTEKVYHRGEVYEKEYAGKPNFFCRLYNDDTIRKRLIEVSGLREVHRAYYVQKRCLWFRMDNPRQNRWMEVSPFLLAPFHLCSVFLCSLLLEPAEPEEIKQEIPGTLCITLEKP